jgi:hypothetical protein
MSTANPRYHRRFLVEAYPHLFHDDHGYPFNIKGTEYFLSRYMYFRKFMSVGNHFKLNEIFHEFPEEAQIILAYHLDMFL